MRTILASVALAALALTRPADTIGQESPARPPAQVPAAPSIFDTTGTAWVYASYFRVPWARVDSLVKLNRYFPAWRARAIEMGCLLDAGLLIHHTGDEYNVVTSYTYASLRAIVPGGGTGACNSRAWREIVPDSTLRAALNQGQTWVYGDAPHYDRIWWVPYPGRR